MPFDYEAARQHYSDAEIKQFLGSGAAQNVVSTGGVSTSPVGQVEDFKTGLDIRKDKAIKLNEIELARPKATTALNQAAMQAAKQMGLANKVATNVGGVNGTGKGAVGPWDYQLPTVFSNTQDTITDIDQLDAANFIEALSALKASSPTGASGLGSATEREGDKVQKGNFNFDRRQSEGRFTQTAQDYRDQIRNSLENTTRAFNETYGTQYTAQDLLKQYAPSPEETKAALKSKYGL
jgi:hypothetical protein